MSSTVSANILPEDELGTAIRPISLSDAARRHPRHFARYLFAAKLARIDRVLDVGCGAGYGTALLAQSACRVIGCDLDERMIAHARRHFGAPRLQFMVHDAHLDFEAEAHPDLITCFEMLEHVRDPGRCIEVLARTVNRDGVVVVSVPNGLKELRNASLKPYHKRRFLPLEFESSLLRWFAKVHFFSQVPGQGMCYRCCKVLHHGRRHPRSYVFHRRIEEDAKTWLAVCRQPAEGPRHKSV